MLSDCHIIYSIYWNLLEITMLLCKTIILFLGAPFAAGSQARLEQLRLKALDRF